MELCGGTHVRNTAQIGFLKITGETGVAAGVRRIEAVTGPGAYEFVRNEERVLQRVADALRIPNDQVERRVTQLVEERRALERRLAEAMRGGGDQLQMLLDQAVPVGGNGVRYVAGTVRAGDVRELQVFGDALRERLGSGVGVVGSKFEDGKGGLIVVVSDDLRERGIRADALVKGIAAAAGGRGGGKAHMAQAGLPDADRFPDAAKRGLELLGEALGGGRT
jgi:alanyl-tRNA synthetase